MDLAAKLNYANLCYTIQTSVSISESSIIKKMMSDTQFADEFLAFSEISASLSRLDTGNALGLLYHSAVIH